MTMSILVDGPPTISIDAGVALQANMVIPENAKGIVVFAHGSGSSRLSIRNRQVAEYLHQHGFATLLFDLLTPTEESVDAVTGHLRFDIPLLATRLGRVTDWLRFAPTTRHLPIAYFGASTGAAAALVAAAEREHVIRAVVSRGGRPDLARPYLSRVQAPTLLIVGGDDPEVLALNRVALRELASTHKKLSVVPGASHLFHEPGALEQVAKLASLWFNQFVAQTPAVALPVPSR